MGRGVGKKRGRGLYDEEGDVMERVNILKRNGITDRSKTEKTTIVKRMKAIERIKIPQDIIINDIIINNITEVSLTL